MANAFFEKYQRNNQVIQNGEQNDNLFQRFIQFKNQYHGNAKEQVMNMLSNGQLSSEAFNAAVQQANQLYGLFKK